MKRTPADLAADVLIAHMSPEVREAIDTALHRGAGPADVLSAIAGALAAGSMGALAIQAYLRRIDAQERAYCASLGEDDTINW